MKSRDFCYWLQGYFEINGPQPRPGEWMDSLNSDQIKVIKNHLAMVFKHEIDPSNGTPEHNQELSKIHVGGGTASYSPKIDTFTGSGSAGGAGSSGPPIAAMNC
jgi:hypothetical protein